MQSLWDKYSIVPGRGVCVFDPGTLMVASMAATAAGGITAGVGGMLGSKATLAGGNYAEMAGTAQRTAAYGQADQIDQNANQSFAAGQRRALDTGSKTRLLISASRARAGASGTDVGTGSPLTNEGEIGKRGSYHALMDMFNGESEATGLHNQAAAVRYSGDLSAWEGRQKKKGTELTAKGQQLAALGTIAGSAGSMAKQYGGYAYPEYRWGA